MPRLSADEIALACEDDDLDEGDPRLADYNNRPWDYEVFTDEDGRCFPIDKFPLDFDELNGVFDVFKEQ